jgi:hypothetical protein
LKTFCDESCGNKAPNPPGRPPRCQNPRLRGSALGLGRLLGYRSRRPGSPTSCGSQGAKDEADLPSAEHETWQLWVWSGSESNRPDIAYL